MGEKEQPVTISIVGTGTGDGGGVAPTPNGTTATTPGGQPNLLVNVVPPVIAIAVRFVNQWLIAFGGFIGADVIAPTLFALDLRQMAVAALATAFVGLIKNLITVFGRLEGKYPLFTGTI
jgi:hypothetical protein